MSRSLVRARWPILACWAAVLLAAPAAPGAEPTTLKLLQTIPLKGAAGRLDHMAIDSKGGRLFVANLSNNSLDVVDLKAGRLVKQVPGQTKIQGIAYAPDLDRIFVGNGIAGTCSVFDGKDYSLLKSLPFPDADNVRYNPRTHLVYVEHAERTLTALDARTYEKKAEVKLPGRPQAFLLEPGRSRLYLNALGPSVVVVIDTDRNEVLRRWPLKLADRGYPIALDAANRRLFVAAREKPVIVVLNADSGEAITAVPIPADVDDLFYDGKRKRLYASCGEGVLAVVRQRDADHYKLLEKIPTVKLARTCFFDPEGDRLYLGLPRQEGKEGPEIRVYLPLP
jgi:DNA-binding beta-propeller fold protein YncE